MGMTVVTSIVDYLDGKYEAQRADVTFVAMGNASWLRHLRCGTSTVEFVIYTLCAS